MPSRGVLSGALAGALLVVGLEGAAAGVPEPTPSLEVRISNREVTIGDRVSVLIGGSDEQEWVVRDVELAQDSDPVWRLVLGPKVRVNVEPPVWELTLAALRVGEQTLPPLRVSWEATATQQRRSEVVTQLPEVSVRSILPAPPAGGYVLKGLRPPAAAAGIAWEWVVPSVLLVMVPVSMLAVLVHVTLRRRRLSVTPEPTPVQELAALQEQLAQPLGEDSLQARCDLAARGVRRFLEQVTGHAACEMTSTELLQLLVGRLSPPTLSALERMLALVDDARFARHAVTQRELSTAASTLELLARELVPEPEEGGDPRTAVVSRAST